MSEESGDYRAGGAHEFDYRLMATEDELRGMALRHHVEPIS